MTKRLLPALAFFVFLSGTLAAAETVIRVGAFPNITHPQAMVGKNNGWFDKAMGPQVKIEWKSFNAGPSAIEALFAGAIDMTYIGPNPAISGYVRSNGEALRIVAAARPLSSGTIPASKRRRIFTARKSRPRKWATRRMSRCAPGSKRMA
jgi:NitT/TauT family transport system substrate-binding protein